MYTESPYWSRAIIVNCVGQPYLIGSIIGFNSQRFGSKRGSGCSQAASRAPEDPGAAFTKSFKN